MIRNRVLLTIGMCCLSITLQADEPVVGQVATIVEPAEAHPNNSSLRAAAKRALTLLETASAGSAEQRKCFNCHGQAMPVIAFYEARDSNLAVETDNLDRQVRHAAEHLRRGRKSYLEGKGQGGGVDTAGYALWTLEEEENASDETYSFVTDWLIGKQRDDGSWKCSSNRPPSEASHFTTTYLAVRALDQFVPKEQSEKSKSAMERATGWLTEADPKDTEDRVFRLLALDYVNAGNEIVGQSIEQLKGQQREDGGWAQKDSMESDAYATATVMYALSEAGMSTRDDAWQAGLLYLTSSQHDDGSWYVESRSKPFQKHFESGFPHGKDQFISMTATAWATIALLRSIDD